MAMVIDAMDLLYARSVDAFAIVSSDADFTPLVMRILTDGVTVYGFGEKKAPEPFVNACSQFTYVEGLVQPSAAPDAPTLKASDPKKLRGDTRLVQMLRNAVDAASGDDGWAQLAQVGSQIGNQTSFDPRNHGYRKLSDLINATGLFEIQRQNLIVLVRDKRHMLTSQSCADSTPRLIGLRASAVQRVSTCVDDSRVLVEDCHARTTGPGTVAGSATSRHQRCGRLARPGVSPVGAFRGRRR